MPAKRPILPAGKADASGACMMSKSAKIYGTLALVLIGFPLFLALWSGISAIMAILLIGAGAYIVAVCLLVASFWHRYFRGSWPIEIGEAPPMPSRYRYAAQPSVVWGKRVPVRVEIGVGRLNKQNN